MRLEYYLALVYKLLGTLFCRKECDMSLSPEINLELLKIAKDIIESNLDTYLRGLEMTGKFKEVDPTQLGYSHLDVLAVAKDLNLFVTGALTDKKEGRVAKPSV
jgi:hypothetical protein